MFPAGETDRSSKAQRTLKMWKSILLSLPYYSLHTFNICNGSLDNTAGPKKKIARHTWKSERTRSFLIFLQSVKMPNPLVYITARQPGCWGQGGVQTPGPFTTWFLCWVSLQPPAGCSSRFVCARNTCPGWAVWLSPLWELTGFPAASLRNWGLLCSVPLWWTFIS